MSNYGSDSEPHYSDSEPHYSDSEPHYSDSEPHYSDSEPHSHNKSCDSGPHSFKFEEPSVLFPPSINMVDDCDYNPNVCEDPVHELHE
jgi:hypothetical protein